jgi:hypothetical protein
MKFETKYNVGDKVWLRIENIESYIKAHPYTEPRKILETCFREGYVNAIKVETAIHGNEVLVSYVISDKRLNEGDDPDYDEILQNHKKILFHRELNVFSNFDEVTNIIKETHKNVLNGLKYIAEKILKKYE